MRRTFARISLARDSARNHKGLSFSWRTFLKPLFFASCTSFLALGSRAMHRPCSAWRILLAVVHADNCRRLKTDLAQCNFYIYMSAAVVDVICQALCAQVRRIVVAVHRYQSNCLSNKGAY